MWCARPLARPRGSATVEQDRRRGDSPKRKRRAFFSEVRARAQSTRRRMRRRYGRDKRLRCSVAAVHYREPQGVVASYRSHRPPRAPDAIIARVEFRPVAVGQRLPRRHRARVRERDGPGGSEQRARVGVSCPLRRRTAPRRVLEVHPARDGHARLLSAERQRGPCGNGREVTVSAAATLVRGSAEDGPRRPAASRAIERPRAAGRRRKCGPVGSDQRRRSGRQGVQPSLP